MTSLSARHTRVAVAQLDIHPAAIVDRRSPLEDPLFELGKADSLSTRDGTIPQGFVEKLESLRARVRKVYCEQLWHKVEAILAACKAWDVKLLVFPECSIPYDILAQLSDAAGDMVVVAGTHWVEPRAFRKLGLKDLYQQLEWQILPSIDSSVCPVLHRGKLLGLQGKLHASHLEQRLKPAKTWQPVALPNGLPSPMGVLICLDFLVDKSETFQKLVSDSLPTCRFLAVPSLTPHHTLNEFAAKAWEEARRYGRSILYANTAGRPSDDKKQLGGGTSIFVDEGYLADLRPFPSEVGILDPLNEGVIVADVDLSWTSHGPGPSRRYDSVQTQRPVVPFAAASLVYRHNPVSDAYAEYLTELTARLNASKDEDAEAQLLEALVDELPARRDVLLNAGALKGCETRNRRLIALTQQADRFGSLDEIRQYTREILLPATALPLSELRATLALACSDVLETWKHEPHGLSYGHVADQLRQAGQPVAVPDAKSWSAAGLAAVRAVRSQFEDLLPQPKTHPAPQVIDRIVLPKDASPASLGTIREGDVMIRFGLRYEELQKGWRFTEDEGLVFDDASPARPQIDLSDPAAMIPIAVSHQNQLLVPLLRAEADADICLCLAQIRSEDQPSTWFYFAFVISHANGHRFAEWLDDDMSDSRLAAQVQEVLSRHGLPDLKLRRVSYEERVERIAAVLTRFDAAQSTVSKLHQLALRDVNGYFEEPLVDIEIADFVQHQGQRAIIGLDEWLDGYDRLALVLGEFGTGKSTTLAEWCRRLWYDAESAKQSKSSPRPILVSLAGAGVATGEELLLQAACLDITERNRAALRLLIEAGLILPVFDGFDEMATRVTRAELPGRLANLLAVAGEHGRVMISSRSHYFPREGDLRDATLAALSQTVGSSSSVRRLHVQLFDEEHIKRLIQGVLNDASKASQAIQQVLETYPLEDLCRRPLLLSMVLKTLDRLKPGTRISEATVYEEYLQHWLKQTDRESGEPEIFNHEQKERLAEHMAAQLWRDGATSCSPRDLERAVRDVLDGDVPTDLPLESAFLEVFGGTFFVRDGEDQFRFAHKSFLEFFFARWLKRTLRARTGEALTTNAITYEVAAFLGELLKREGEWTQSTAALAVRQWLQTGRATDSANSQATAAANGLMLLVHLRRWAELERTWGTAGADLRDVELLNSDLSDVDFTDANLAGANFSGCHLRRADFTRANLTAAQLRGTLLDTALLSAARAAGANFTQATVSACQLQGVNLQGAELAQSVWIDYLGEPQSLEGVRGTAALSMGCSGLMGQLGYALPASTDHAQFSPAWCCLPTFVRGHQGCVWAISWSPDGRRLASAGDDGSVRIWDAELGRELIRCNGHQGGVRSLSWSVDGRRLASGGCDGTIRIWEAAQGHEITRCNGHQGEVLSVSWNSDNRRVASGGFDGTIRIWEAAQGHEITRCNGHQGEVNSVSWRIDGLSLVSGGSDGSVREWDADRGKERVRLDGHVGEVNSVCWSADGQQIVSGGDDGSVCVWNSERNFELMRSDGHADYVLSVAWSMDGKYIAIGGSDSDVTVLDVKHGEEYARYEAHRDWIRSVSWSPIGHRLASGGDDGSVCVWDLKHRQELAHWYGHRFSVWSVSWSADGQRLASGGDNGIRIWDAVCGQELVRYYEHNGIVKSVSWSACGRYVASGGSEIHVWDTNQQREIRLTNDQHGSVVSISLSADGQYLASAYSNGGVYLFETKHGHEFTHYYEHSGGVRSVSCSANGLRVASGGDNGRVCVWDAKRERVLTRCIGHRGAVNSVSLNLDGRHIASGGEDGSVRIWDAERGHQITRCDGHQSGVLSVAWSADGRRLASSGEDGSVRIWDAEHGRQITRCDGHQSSVLSVAWSADGRRLASGGEDGSLRVWDASNGQLLAVFEAWDDEWLCRTPLGYFRSSKELTRVAWEVPRPERHTTRLFQQPAARVSEVLRNPERVAAALAGDLSIATLEADFAQRGWQLPAAWDGETRVLSDLVRTAAVDTEVKHIEVDQTPSRFRPGPPLAPEDPLIGRDEIFQEILAKLGARCSIRLLAPRRAGKTSLFQHLEQALRTRGHAVTRLSAESFSGKTTNALASFLLGEAPARRNAAARYEKHIKTLQKPVLLLDEIGKLSRCPPETFGWLRSLTQTSPLAVVYTGTARDWQLIYEIAHREPGSSFGNDCTLYELGPIEAPVARQFLIDRLPGEDQRSACAEWIVELVGGWPFYLQVLGFAVEQAVRRGQRKALVDKDGVREFYEAKLLTDPDGILKSRWAELTVEQQAFVLSDPASIPPPFKELSLSDLDQLTDAGLCSTSDWLPDRPFWEWLRANRQRLQNAPPKRKPRR